MLRKITKRIKYAFLSKDEKRHALVGPAKLWKMKQDFQYDFLLNHGLKPNSTLLDIGCGTLRGGIRFIEFLDPRKYHGLDVRPKALQEGESYIKEKNLDSKLPKLHLINNYSSYKIEQSFDFAFAFSVLFHMTDEICSECFLFVHQHLSTNGKFYANIHVGDEKGKHWREFPVVYRSFDWYQNLADQTGFEMTNLGDLESLGHSSGIGYQDDQFMLEFKKN